MTSLVQKAGTKLFEKHIQQYAPADPLYETYTDNKGRTKRRKRDVPLGLSTRDAAILRSVNKRAHYLDKGVNLCGFKVGWTFFIGAIPGAGDVVNALLGYLLVIRKARQADIPPWLLSRMLVNMAISTGIGLVPVAGDVCIAVFKTNSRNAALLEEYLRIRGEEYLKTERERIQNEDEIKPGHGKVPGEKVDGETPANGTRKRSSFWSRSSKKEVPEVPGALPDTSETPNENAVAGPSNVTKAKV